MLKISQQQQTLFFAGALNRDTVPGQWPFKLLKKLNGAAFTCPSISEDVTNAIGLGMIEPLNSL